MGASSSYPTPALPSSRTVIVTGGNTGIGYETAKAIARMGARVIIACRSEEKAKEVSTTVKLASQVNLLLCGTTWKPYMKESTLGLNFILDLMQND